MSDNNLDDQLRELIADVLPITLQPLHGVHPAHRIT